jgi:hypothetical protein
MQRLLRLAVRESQLREREWWMGLPALQEAALGSRKMQALGFIYAGGFVVTMIALYTRVGFPAVKPDWREFLLPNLPWLGLMLFKAWAWPVTLGIWLYNGRQPTAWTAVTKLDGREVRAIKRTSSMRTIQAP